MTQDADYGRGDWLLTLVCCGREDGFQVCPTNAAAEEFRAAYLDAQGHDRVAILSKLDQPVRVGFHPQGWTGPSGSASCLRRSWRIHPSEKSRGVAMNAEGTARDLGHITKIGHDRYQFYFSCSAGDVTTTNNAFATREEAEAAAQAHEQGVVTKKGRVLTESALDALADEAERGYGFDEMRSGPELNDGQADG
jgi:hypothetical protein